MKAIVGGTLIHTEGANPIENSVILIEENKIVKVGKSEGIPIPQDVQIINVKESGSFPV